MESRKNQLLISASLLTGIGTLIVFLRFFARGWVTNQLGKDDWIMFGAWIFTVVYLGIIGLSIRYGQGLPGAEQEPEWLEPALKCVMAIEIVYYIIVYQIKCSILIFYVRLGRHAFVWFDNCAKYTIYLLSVFLFICLTVVFTQCIPMEKNWNLLAEGTCINTTAFFYSTSVFNIITDVWILVLPIKLLWKVQRATFEKLALIGVFTMGGFACVASCVRLYTIEIFTKSADPLYDAVPINIWSMIEINIAIICASVPAIRVIFGMQSSRANSRTPGVPDEANNFVNNSGGLNQPKHDTPGGNSPFALRAIKHSLISTTLTTTIAGGDSQEQITGNLPSGLQSTTGSAMNQSTDDISSIGYGSSGGDSRGNDDHNYEGQIPQSAGSTSQSQSTHAGPSIQIEYKQDIIVEIEERKSVGSQGSRSRSGSKS